jgi:hypothetical protein
MWDVGCDGVNRERGREKRRKGEEERERGRKKKGLTYLSLSVIKYIDISRRLLQQLSLFQLQNLLSLSLSLGFCT